MDEAAIKGSNVTQQRKSVRLAQLQLNQDSYRQTKML
jgi:hypothetical protein